MLRLRRLHRGLTALAGVGQHCYPTYPTVSFLDTATIFDNGALALPEASRLNHICGSDGLVHEGYRRQTCQSTGYRAKGGIAATTSPITLQ